MASAFGTGSPINSEAVLLIDRIDKHDHAVLQQLEAEDCRPSIAVGNSSTLANLAMHNDIDFHLSLNVSPDHLNDYTLLWTKRFNNENRRSVSLERCSMQPSMPSKLRCRI
jgi:hypothetical protein